VPTPHAAESIFEELRTRRDCGVVRAGMADTTSLETTASAFSLDANPAIYRCFDAESARRLLTRILHRDLAYDMEILPIADAERLAVQVLELVPNGQFFTNGTFDQPVVKEGRVIVGASWNPATEATFDTGVIVVGSAVSICVWVEDED